MNVRDVLPRDAIPSIDDPSFGTEHVGDPDDEVLVLEGDPPRAYPIRILNYHEVVNDVADAPVAVTWCPLCASGVVYERVVDGRTTWDGPTGRAADGRRLTRLPARRLFAFAWQDDHGPGAFYSPP